MIRTLIFLGLLLCCQFLSIAQVPLVVVDGRDADPMPGLPTGRNFYIGTLDSAHVFHLVDSLLVIDSIWGWKQEARIDGNNLYWLASFGGRATTRVSIRFGTIPHEEGKLRYEQATLLEVSRRRPKDCFVGAKFGRDIGPEIETGWGLFHGTTLVLPAYPLEKKMLKKLFRICMRTARGYPKAIRSFATKNLLESI